MSLFDEITALPTEQSNPLSQFIDTFSTTEILECINAEDARVANAVRKVIPEIAVAVENIVERFKRGGRLIYVGAGTSGRLGIIDASECPPTFGVSPEMVQGIIAGGNNAMFAAQEGAEDSEENAKIDLKKLSITPNDIVCGIAASGRTPYVRGAVEEAKNIGAYTIFISTNSPENLKKLRINTDTVICPHVGAEVITGSTRLKSGTAQKMVLNMLTTAAMIRLGKTYGNIMVDLQLTNAKLRERAKNILMSITGIDYQNAEQFLQITNGNVKVALVMILANVDYDSAKDRLDKSDGFIRKAIAE